MSMQTSAQTPERVLQRLDWQVIRRLDGLLQGDYRSLFYGYGVDFADLREYQPEDDIRYIDWNVTARMDTPYVRQYVEDREITAWFLLDLSPSIDFGPTLNMKRAVLISSPHSLDCSPATATALARSSMVGALTEPFRRGVDGIRCCDLSTISSSSRACRVRRLRI
jgi:Protein of unknown function DUF58